MPSTFESTFKARCVPAVERAFGVSVSISRGAIESVSFTARRMAYKHSVIGADMGFPTKVVERVFRLPSEKVDFGGGEVPPVENDRIKEVSGDVTEVFEIMPGDDMPAVEYEAAFDEYVVHTKKVD